MVKNGIARTFWAFVEATALWFSSACARRSMKWINRAYAMRDMAMKARAKSKPSEDQG
jgi:hypothetical protein